MSQRKQNHDPALFTVPPTIVRALELAHRTARAAAWAERLVERTRISQRAVFAMRLTERLLMGETPGVAAEELAQRLIPESGRNSDQDMALATYAPPQRQISAARQGAPDWQY